METLVVVLIVLAAALFIARRIVRSVRSARTAKAACADCGCGTAQSTQGDWSKT